MRKIAAVCLTAILIPYISTLAWTGRVEGMVPRSEKSGRTVLLDRGTGRTVMDLEEYLIGLTAVQIPPEYEKEAIKAQTIIARTAVCRQMEEGNQIAESALDMDYLEQSQMEALWGRDNYLEYYRLIRDAVQETSGQVIRCNGEYIEPLFHRLGAGQTRQGDALHPYLASVQTPEDVEGEGYLSILIFTREEMAERLNAMADSPEVRPEEVPENIQIIERDEAGYVESVQVNGKAFRGDAIRYALGLPSPFFHFEDYEGRVRCTVRGIGHGYGLDQYGAERMAAEGRTAEEILKKYYKNIVIVTE